jgi:hypothetical protein
MSSLMYLYFMYLSTYLNHFLTLITWDHGSCFTNSVSKTENLICNRRDMSKARHTCSISMCYLTSSIFFISLSILMFFSCSLLLFLPISDSRFVTFSLWRFPFSWNSMLCKCHRQTFQVNRSYSLKLCSNYSISDSGPEKACCLVGTLTNNCKKWLLALLSPSLQMEQPDSQQMFMKFHICDCYNWEILDKNNKPFTWIPTLLKPCTGSRQYSICILTHVTSTKKIQPVLVCVYNNNKNNNNEKTDTNITAVTTWCFSDPNPMLCP